MHVLRLRIVSAALRVAAVSSVSMAAASPALSVALFRALTVAEGSVFKFVSVLVFFHKITSI